MIDIFPTKNVHAKRLILVAYCHTVSYIIMWLRQMTHSDWLISSLEKAILPAEESHLAHSCKHCTNEILTKIKTYYAI